MTVTTADPPSYAQCLAGAQALGLERLDAQLLLLHALGKSAAERAWLLTHDNGMPSAEAVARFEALTLRRAGGEPLAYLVGHKEFFGLVLQVDQRVLVPRPDTETLVQWALDILCPTGKIPGTTSSPALSPASAQDAQKSRILDLGTGSGAIALAIAHSLRAAGQPADVTAVDASADALEVARENATRLNLEVELIESRWFDEVGGHFHLIASNPPYIAADDAHLEALVHEPRAALVAGSEGLDDLRHIIENAPFYLYPGGWLMLEHGYDQAAKVKELLAQRGFSAIASRLDLAGIARCSGGCWRPATAKNHPGKTAG